MKNWAKKQFALRDFFSEATGIQFVWENNPRKLLQKPFGVLCLGQSVTIGRDHFGYTFRNSGITLDIEGQRLLTLNAQVYARSQMPNESARHYLEKARLALANPDLKETLRQAQLYFVETHPINDIDFTFSKRHESRASLDIVFRGTVLDERPAQHTGYFNKVELQEANF